MGILWESYGNPMGILWGSNLESYGNSSGILFRILWDFFGDPIENPMGILWGSY